MRGRANENRRDGGQAVAAVLVFNPSPGPLGHPLPQGEREIAYAPGGTGKPRLRIRAPILTSRPRKARNCSTGSMVLPLDMMSS